MTSVAYSHGITYQYVRLAAEGSLVMAKTRVQHVIAASCCATVSIALLITSLATEYWITADITAPGSEEVSTVNYGLFSGTYLRKIIGTTQTFNVYPVCDEAEGICMMSCLDTADARLEELTNLYQLGTGTFRCTPSVINKFLAKTAQPTGKSIKSDNFIQNGFLKGTLSILIIACVIGLIGLLLNIYNIFANPIYSFLSLIYVPALYLGSSVLSVIVLILWGVQYASWISVNVALLDTLVASYKSDAILGWSYYIIIGSCVSNANAAILLIVREKLLTREESARTIKGDEVNNDANTFMY